MNNTNKLPNDAILCLTWLEAGYLRGALEMNKQYGNLPKSLKLKLDILFTQAYLCHESLGERAKTDIENFRKELLKIESKK